MMRTVAGVVMMVLIVAPASLAQRIRFGPGVCGPIGASLIWVTNGTGGQPFPMSPAEIAKSSSVIESSFLPEMILWASGKMERSYSIPVDPSVERVQFSATFDRSGGSFTLIAPDGTIVQAGNGVEDTLLNCGRIITIDGPASGVWRARTAPSGRFWLLVHAKSDRSLTDAEFVERAAGPEADRLVTIQGAPIAGRPATMRVDVAEDIQEPTFRLVSLDARPLQSVALVPAGDGEFVGTIDLPAEPFRLLVTGHDETGMAVQRIWPGLFHSESVEVVPPAGETVSAGAETPVVFTIRNYGPAVHVTLGASDSKGHVAVEPAALELDAHAEAVATVRLTVPADAAPQSTTTIRLTASTTPTADVARFNSASKTFTIAR